MQAEDNPTTPAYLWFDTEFTDLDAERARLLQVALLVTDANLNRLGAATLDVNLHIALEPGTYVSEWVEGNLTELLKVCRSEQAVAIEQADARLAASVDAAVGPRGDDIKLRPVLAGNTVHMDMQLVRRFLPEFTKRLHYRVLDVSTVKTLCHDWFGNDGFDKESSALVQQYLPEGIELASGGVHDAYYDIQASLAELNYYRQQLSCKSARGST